MELCLATFDDIPQIMGYIAHAKAHLKALAVDQWQDGYPNEERIRKDIELKQGYLLKDKDVKMGYLAVGFEGDPFYQTIQGSWKSDLPYGVIHRLALAPEQKGKGIAGVAFSLVEELCKSKNIHSIKVDTDEQNTAMNHILKKCGFAYCGVINFDGSDKVAYEKLF